MGNPWLSQWALGITSFLSRYLGTMKLTLTLWPGVICLPTLTTAHWPAIRKSSKADLVLRLCFEFSFSRIFSLCYLLFNAWKVSLHVILLNIVIDRLPSGLVKRILLPMQEHLIPGSGKFPGTEMATHAHLPRKSHGKGEPGSTLHGVAKSSHDLMTEQQHFLLWW